MDGFEALSKRERDCLHYLVVGYSNKEIAQHLGTSENTVRKQIQSIYGKLGVHRRGQAVFVWLRGPLVW